MIKKCVNRKLRSIAKCGNTYDCYHKPEGVYHWDKGNKLTIKKNYILGEGRLSTFGELESDAIGENGKSDPNRAGD